MSKNIILCSDGTGQKGGYGADSNVYKLYRAVNLHTAECEQISFYDNGVGTTEDNSDSKANKFIRAISGGFGFGFLDNVCSLYSFLAEHYEIGDRIYFFGFSRGAATVRACTGFITTCGLLDKNKVNNDQEWTHCLQQAVLAYQKHKTQPQLAQDFKARYAIHDKQFAVDGELKIHFVGVWDTVSALGFSKDWSLLLDPLFVMLDNVSDHFFPHCFYRYGLSKNIDHAYHALSIDDARKTFHPKVWNEVKPEYKDVNVEQVWFAGVHSNVGGGYPRTGLSNVAFDWMMTRAEKHGLHFIHEDRAMAAAHSDATGKLFNSRDGLGCYYRYQPRNLSKLCEKNGQSKLRGNIKIHDTVIKRLQLGFAGYAPSYMPSEFEIVATDLKTPARKVTIIDKDEWHQAANETESWINKRRALYHVFMELSLLLVVISGLMWKYPPAAITPYLHSGGAEEPVFFVFRWLHSILTYITPVFFENFLTYAIKAKPLIFIGLVAVVYATFKARTFVLKNLQQSLEKSRAILLRNL